MQVAEAWYEVHTLEFFNQEVGQAITHHSSTSTWYVSSFNAESICLSGYIL